MLLGVLPDTYPVGGGMYRHPHTHRARPAGRHAGLHRRSDPAPGRSGRGGARPGRGPWERTRGSAAGGHRGGRRSIGDRCPRSRGTGDRNRDPHRPALPELPRQQGRSRDHARRSHPLADGCRDRLRARGTARRLQLRPTAGRSGTARQRQEAQARGRRTNPQPNTGSRPGGPRSRARSASSVSSPAGERGRPSARSRAAAAVTKGVA